MEEKVSYSAEENTSFFARVGRKKFLAAIATFVVIFSALVVGGKFLSSRIGRQPSTLFTAPESTAKPTEKPLRQATSVPQATESSTPEESQAMPQMLQSEPAECRYGCEELLAYNSNWQQIPSSTLTNGELEVPQTIYFLVKGDTDCEDAITQARLKFKGESANAWRYSSEIPPSGIAGDCDDGTYYCFYWEEEFTEVGCYDAESEVCMGDACN